jgi:hypothetical protein
MTLRHATLAALCVVPLAAAPAVAADNPPTLDPARSEVSVFGGLSILDAHGTTATVSVTDPRTGSEVSVPVRAEMGNGGLFGARYAFYLRKQLAVEADLAVAPGQRYEGGVGACATSGPCTWTPPGAGDRDFGAYGRGMRGGRFFGPDGHGFGRDLTAWHYGAGLTYDLLGGDVRPYVTAGAGGVSYDGPGRTETDFVVRFGGGLKVYFGRVGARVDVVDHLVIDQFVSGRAEHDVHATGGVLVRF